MISRLLYALENGLRYVRKHPKLLFVLLIVVVLPLAFWYSGQQFLEAGRENQERLQKDRIGLMHDVFISLMTATQFDITKAQSEIETIASLNPDITKFRIVYQVGNEFRILAALDKEAIGDVVEQRQIFQSAAGLADDDSLIFEFIVGGERLWQAARATRSDSGDFYYVFTENSLAGVDYAFWKREVGAYFTLAIIYLLVLAIAYWHVRITDYQYLYNEAQDAIKAKDRFMNMIAHELRAPLTAIKGYASMITESDQTKSQEREYATRIVDSADRLVAIVSDLLDVARIQSGKLSIQSEVCDISKTVISVVEELLPSAREKSIALSHTGTEEKHEVQTDPKRMHQAIANLVSNSIKYTKKGGIEVAIVEHTDNIELRVKDTGMGISAEDQKQLFAPFFRVHRDDVQNITGSGLGMWITRQLIELMGATIGVESIKGVGTHIVVHIPKQPD